MVCADMFAAGAGDLRLPDAIRTEALAAGAKRVKTYPQEPTFDLDVIGPEWTFCSWLEGEERWCLAAYQFARGGSPPC
jgi:hypothetical protein